MEPTRIEPVASCLQSGCADAGWRQYTPKTKPRRVYTPVQHRPKPNRMYARKWGEETPEWLMTLIRTGLSFFPSLPDREQARN